MPTYQYECTRCGHHFELVQSMKDTALQTCPKDVCPQKKWGQGKVNRLVGTGAGLIFKGSGFYITDYRSENYKAAAKKEQSASEKPAESKPKSEPSKPAASPASKPASSA